jgi:hypothetical protein
MRAWIVAALPFVGSLPAQAAAIGLLVPLALAPSVDRRAVRMVR